LNLISDVYKEAADNARASVQELKRDVNERWDETRRRIADVWKKYADDAEAAVRDVRRQAEQMRRERGESLGQAERAMETAAARVHGVYRDAAQRARAQAEGLQESVAGSWEDYRSKLLELWMNAAREAEDQVRQLGRAAANLGQPEPSLFAPSGDYLGGHREPSQYVYPSDRERDRGYAHAGRPGEGRPGVVRRAAETLGSMPRQAGEYVRETAEDVAHRARDAARGAADTVRGAADTVKGVAEGARESYEDMRDRFRDIYHRAAESAQRQASNLRHAPSDTAEDISRKIQDVFGDASRRAEDEVHRMSSHLPSLRSGWQATKDTIGGAVDRAAEGLGLHSMAERARDAYDMTSGCFTLGQWYEKAMETARQGVNALQQRPSSTWQQTKDAIQRIYDESFGDVDKRIEDLRAELEHAEHRKQELDRIQHKLDDLPEQRGESWDSQKRRIAGLYDRAMADTARNPFKRAYQAITGTVGSLFGRKQPEQQESSWEAWPKGSGGGGGWQPLTSTFEDGYNSAARTLKRTWSALTPDSNSFSRLKDTLSEQFDRLLQSADQQVAELRRKPREQLTASERAQLELADKTKRAGESAKEALSKLTQKPGESFQDAKDRMWEIYRDLWEIAPTAVSTGGGSAWQSIRDTVGGAWEHVKGFAGKADVPAVFERKLEKAEHDANKLYDAPGGDFRTRLHKIVEVYTNAINEAENEISPVILNVHEAQQQGRHVPADALRQAQVGQAYLNAMRQGLKEAAALSSPSIFSDESFVRTNERVFNVLRNAFAHAQSDTNVSHQAFPKRWRAEFAHFLEEAATKWGLHNPSYQWDKQVPAEALGGRSGGWAGL
jgi:regulator of replication initiation timing